MSGLSACEYWKRLKEARDQFVAATTNVKGRVPDWVISAIDGIIKDLDDLIYEYNEWLCEEYSYTYLKEKRIPCRDLG